MKACHLTSVHSAFDNRIFYKECCSLVKVGFDITLIAPAENDETRDGVKIIAVKKGSSRFRRMITTVKDVYRKAIDLNADLYHFHDPELIRIGLNLKRQGKKVIYDVHEDVPRQLLAKHYLPEFSRGIIASRFEKYEDNAVKIFDEIITVTPLLEKRFKSLNPNTAQVCNFPSLDEFGITNMSWGERKSEICYAGSITEIRGIREMIQALEAVNTKLHLAGNFSPSSLHDEISKLPAWNKVIEHGYLSREKIQALYASCKVGLVLLHPTLNYQDAYPIKMFEYMAAGIPVIASDFPLWKEIVETHHCGICIDPLNVAAISDAIDYLLSHETEAQQMGLNGRIAVMEKFNWHQEEGKLIEVYRRLEK